MKRMSHHVRPGTLLCACFASAVLIGGALAQPPKPGGAGGGGGGPGSGPGAGPAAPGAGPGPGGGGGPGAAPSPTFNLRFCNKTNDTPVIFITTASAAGQQFRAQGWAQIPQGQCVSAGSFQRPSVWWHGRAPNGTTWGDAKSGIDLCVNLNAGFDYTWDGSARQCGQGENSVPFMKLDIQPHINNFDMNLN
ncbi:MAG: DUF1036 domain-containing protein [Xanthobacteraceae bacterium]|nr:DUF1036 domain-containing protein [Xanthobacteraceae bacterium]